MARYENSTRVPNVDRHLEIANILTVEINVIKEYDFKEPADIVYILI